MGKQRKQPDINQLAASIVDKATAKPTKQSNPKNPHAVALGRLGGLRGGPARAKKLTKARRVAIAKKAIAARWSKVKHRP